MRSAPENLVRLLREEVELLGYELVGVELTGQAAKQVNVYAGNLFIRNGFIASLTEFEREMRG